MHEVVCDQLVERSQRAGLCGARRFDHQIDLEWVTSHGCRIPDGAPALGKPVKLARDRGHDRNGHLAGARYTAPVVSVAHMCSRELERVEGVAPALLMDAVALADRRVLQESVDVGALERTQLDTRDRSLTVGCVHRAHELRNGLPGPMRNREQHWTIGWAPQQVLDQLE